MGIEVLIPLLAVFSIFFIPIAGLTFILTTRFALKPLVETLARALRESGQGASQDLYLRLQDLTDTVDALRNEVQILREVQDFDKKLLGSTGISDGTEAPTPETPATETPARTGVPPEAGTRT
jgi:hypothetical protein